MISGPSLVDLVAEFARTFTGRVLRPVDPGYEEARKVHNSLVDKRPELIARSRGVADIADAIMVARDFARPRSAGEGGQP
jgi:hypothetical protein